MPFSRVEGRAYPIGRANIDTDMIIPAEHLKTTVRTGLGRYAFQSIRGVGGSPFDDPAFTDAPILIAGDNFGCGSSREHAVWALLDLGVRAVIAPSFADIFASNAFKNGLAAVELPPPSVERLLQLARDYPVSVDLELMEITAPAGESFPFTMDTFRRRCLLEGLDEIALTMASEAAISRYERRTAI